MGSAMHSPRTFKKGALFRYVGYEPHPGQRRVHDSRAPRRVLAAGTRWGKSRAAAMEGLAALLEPRERSMGWVVAPSYDLSEKIFREIALLAAEHFRHRIISLKESEKRLVLLNLAGGLSEARGKSADSPVSLLGEALDWLLVDEAARMKPAIWEAYLSQRLIDRRGWSLLISTPKGKGWFFESYRRGQGLDPDYESWNEPSWSNPHLPRDLIERERERLPERVFREEYGGEFIEGAGQVFRYVREAATGELRDPVPGERYAAGLDLARVEDFTVLVILTRRLEVVHVERFHRLDWGLQVLRLKAALERYGNPPVYVDATGVGDPILEALRREGLAAKAYPFTQKSKAALVDNLSLKLESRSLVLPRAELWPEGIEELESFQYSITESGNTRAAAPWGVHDDCVMALALAAWAFAAPPEPPIELVGVVVRPSRREPERRHPLLG